MSQPNEKIRIILSAEQSAQLDQAGEKCFSIVSRIMRTERPDENLRWVIHLAPVSWQSARDASAVLAGTARAVRPRSK